MTQLPLQWNDAVVHDLLHYPHRLLHHDAWAAVIAEAGGLVQMRQQLLEFPLKAKERRVLEVILAYPEASVVRYTDLLAMHHATFHRQQNALCRSLSHFLNLVQVPAATEAAPRSEVVLPWTSFVGRSADLLALHEVLAGGARWISLVGTGGVGKTRLALELAQQSIGAICEEVHLLRFADVQRAEDVGLACIQQLHLALAEAQSVEQAVRDFFQQRRSLVIVDNLEHIPAAGMWLAQVFQSLPQQQVLATSRVRLNVPAEQIYEVEVLEYPALETPSETLASYSAVQLCLDRMEAVRLVDRSNAQLLVHVGQICRHVAGLPLAIELVAARTAESGLETILAAIRNDVAFIGEGPLDLDVRQQTMAATIAWSYQLLPIQSQQIIQRLGVFQAGWDVAAAAAVCQLELELMEDHLALLVDNHLISQIRANQYQTYAILEPIRQYLWASVNPEFQWHLRLSHCDYYIEWVMPTEDLLIGPDYALWGQSMREAYANISFALDTARAEQNPLRLWQLLAAMYRFWWRTDLMVEAQSWIMPQVPALLQPTEYPYWQARALYTTLIFGLKDTADYSREATFNYLVQLAQRHQFKLIEARAKNFYGIIIRNKHTQNQVNKLLIDAINIYRELGDTVNILSPMLNYGNSMYGMRRLEEAYQIYAELLDKFRINGDYDGIHSSMKNMAIMCIYLGRYTEAEKIIITILNEEKFDSNLVDFVLLYVFLIKIYFFLGDYQQIDACVRKIYPLAIDNTIFIGRVITVCESIIYLAMAKEYYAFALNIFQYMLNAIHYEQYEMEWFQSEFVEQTKIVLSQHYGQLEFLADDEFVLDYHSFNDTMNYFLKIMHNL